MSRPNPPRWAPEAGVYLAIENHLGVTTVVGVWEDGSWRRPSLTIEIVTADLE